MATWPINDAVEEKPAHGWMDARPEISNIFSLWDDSEAKQCA